MPTRLLMEDIMRIPSSTFCFAAASFLVFSRPSRISSSICLRSVASDFPPSTQRRSVSYASTRSGLSSFTASYACVQSWLGSPEGLAVSGVTWRDVCALHGPGRRAAAVVGFRSWGSGSATGGACGRGPEVEVGAELARDAGGRPRSARFQPIFSRTLEGLLNGIISSRSDFNSTKGCAVAQCSPCDVSLLVAAE